MEIFQLIAPFAIAAAITALLTPSWIAVCNKWHLFDTPDLRKHHVTKTPSMGGLAILAGIFISFCIFSGNDEFFKLKFILGSTFLLFFTGIFDDLLNVPPTKNLSCSLLPQSLR